MGLVEVNVGFRDNIIWKPKTACDFKLDNKIDLWRINIASNAPVINTLQGILNPDEIARANRYVQVKDRVRFMVSRIALRQIISGYNHQPAADILFHTGPNKKPYITGSTLKYNVSHSGNWVVIGIANHDIGVDTEYIDEQFNYSAILKDNFNKAEIGYIGQSAENFFLLWTRKEALTKFTGQGLSEGLSQMNVLDGLNYIDSEILWTNSTTCCLSFKLDKDNLGSIAYQQGLGDLRFFDINDNNISNKDS